MSDSDKQTEYERPEGCICTMFSDTGGFRIADLTCPVHGVHGTEPGDGYWKKRRKDEHRRRALAQEHRGEVVEDSGTPIDPKDFWDQDGWGEPMRGKPADRLSVVVSVRLTPYQEDFIRAVAGPTGLSAFLREAAMREAERAIRSDE